MPLRLLMAIGQGYSSEVTWANWDEASQDTLASDDIFVNLFKNTNAGGNETGAGGNLTGADLVLTAVGNPAGATGTPPTRVLDGANDYFSMTTAAADALICNANKTWTIILKVTGVTLVNNDTFFGFEATGSAESLRCFQDATARLYFLPYQDGVGDSRLTTDAIAISTTYYIAMWADGTVLRAGFSTTRPTKWSDFAANKRIEFATDTGDYAGETFNVASNLFANYAGSGWSALSAYYVVMSKTCLIDNAA